MDPKILIIFLIFYMIFSTASTYSCEKGSSIFKQLKAIPIFMLIFFLFFTIFTKGTSLYAIKIIAGLAFGLAGDFFLLNKEKYFLHGLFTFLIGHVFFLWAFFSIEMKIPQLIIISIMVFSAVFSCYIFYNLLKKKNSQLIFPTALYVMVITAMTIFGINLDFISYGKMNLTGIGAVLFMASDSFLAYDNFVGKFRYGDTAILSTYYSAQLFISLGAIIK